MRAIRIQYDGNDNTRILWDKDAEGKLLMTQKYLMNVATDKASDPIFPDRGTDLMRHALGGTFLISPTTAGTFASVDTLYFCNYEESAGVFASSDNVTNFALTSASYNNATSSVNMAASFTFQDGTSYNTTLTVTDNG